MRFRIRTGATSPERGQVIILFVAIFTAIAVIGAIVVDFGLWFSERRGAQKDADLAALAGAWELLDATPVAAQAEAAAAAFIDLNDQQGNSSLAQPIVVDNSCWGQSRLDAVIVDVDHESRSLFASIFNLVAPDIGAHAKACAGSVTGTSGLRPFAIESEPVCLRNGTCNPAADSDCFEYDASSGIMVPKFGSWCQLDDGSRDDSTSQRGLVDLEDVGSVCSTGQGGASDVRTYIKRGAGGWCKIGDKVEADRGGKVGGDIQGIRDLLAGDGADCDRAYGVPAPGVDHTGIDDFDEVVLRTDGGTGPSPTANYQLRDCKSPRVINILVIGNFAQDPVIKGFAAFYILGCKMPNDPLTVLPNKCETGAPGQLQLWGIFFNKVELGGDIGEWNPFGTHTIAIVE